MILRNLRAIGFSPAHLEKIDVRVETGTVTGHASTLAPLPGEEIVDLEEKLVLPGLVCAHTHLYSSLARGMPGPRRSPKNFLEILQNIWWKLDQRLDEETIYYSALVGGMEAARLGTTVIFDHHASPNCIRGSLDLIKEALQRVGIRAVLCYETTDRGGKKKRDEGLDENERFIGENRHGKCINGMIGAHASFTLGDQSLERLANAARRLDRGVHMHVAEDRSDVRDARRRHAGSIVKRLRDHGLLGKQTILAHGVHLSGKDCGEINRSGAWMIHNPRSNMNNGVGYAPVARFGPRTALGTDGFPADMFEETRTAYYRNRESTGPVPPSRMMEMLSAGYALASEHLGAGFGRFAEGSPADFTVLDYRPPTPVTDDTLTAHLLLGVNALAVESVMINGRWITWNRGFVALDEEQVLGDARKVAERLWRIK